MPRKAMNTWANVACYFCEKESYLSWLTLIKVAFPYMQQTHFSEQLYLSIRIQKRLLSLSTSEVLKER